MEKRSALLSTIRTLFTISHVLSFIVFLLSTSPTCWTTRGFVRLSVQPESSEQAVPSTQATSDIAIAMGGQLRTMLDSVVYSSFKANMPTGDLFVVIPTPDGRLNGRENDIVHTYQPKRLKVISEAQQQALLVYTCPCKYQAAGRVLTQWANLKILYNMIEEQEFVRQKQYKWILRTRTDTVFLEPVVMNKFDADYAYLPRDGMNFDPRAMCQNDHFFACPRHLCSPYFNLINQFTGNSSCDQVKYPEQEQVSALQFPEIHILMQYNSGIICDATLDGQSCCGRLREFDLEYTLTGHMRASERAKGKERTALRCEYTLRSRSRFIRMFINTEWRLRGVEKALTKKQKILLCDPQLLEDCKKLSASVTSAVRSTEISRWREAFLALKQTYLGCWIPF